MKSLGVGGAGTLGAGCVQEKGLKDPWHQWVSGNGVWVAGRWGRSGVV